MKKIFRIAAFAFLGFSFNQMNAQLSTTTPNVPDFTMKAIFKSEWKVVIDLLKNEQWADAEKTATGYLTRAEKDTYHAEDAAVLRYMIINAISGELANGLTDKETALKKLKPLEGKEVVTPPLTFKSRGILNSLLLADDGMAWTQTTTNKEQDMVVLKETFKVAFLSMLQETTKYDGNNFRLRATVGNITANNPAHPRLDVVYNNTEIWDISLAK
ncbi:MAG: hypothetical protein ACLGH8_10185 [Bacteroidia bacterium]